MFLNRKKNSILTQRTKRKNKSHNSKPFYNKDQPTTNYNKVISVENVFLPLIYSVSKNKLEQKYRMSFIENSDQNFSKFGYLKKF